MAKSRVSWAEPVLFRYIPPLTSAASANGESPYGLLLHPTQNPMRDAGPSRQAADSAGPEWYFRKKSGGSGIPSGSGFTKRTRFRRIAPTLKGDSIQNEMEWAGASAYPTTHALAVREFLYQIDLIVLLSRIAPARKSLPAPTSLLPGSILAWARAKTSMEFGNLLINKQIRAENICECGFEGFGFRRQRLSAGQDAGRHPRAASALPCWRRRHCPTNRPLRSGERRQPVPER